MDCGGQLVGMMRGCDLRQAEALSEQVKLLGINRRATRVPLKVRQLMTDRIEIQQPVNLAR